MEFSKQVYPTKQAVEAFLEDVANATGGPCPVTPELARRIGLDVYSFEYMTHIHQWQSKRGPFLNVYPSVLECLKNTSIAIDPAAIPRSVVHQFGVMEVRPPVTSRMPAFFICFDDPRLWSDGTVSPGLLVTFIRGEQVFHFLYRFGELVSMTSMDQVENGLPLDDSELVEAREIARVAFGVLLLAADERYCEPILLNRDKRKTLTDKQRELAVDRAHRRGVVGFSVGASIELSPHFRRPHFAIRWTGKGASVPRLVPIKGAVINRGVLEQIPSGFEYEKV